MEILANKVMSLTKEYGGQWGVNHIKRILQIISTIGEGLQYNKEAVMLAAYLHDWGAYPKWIDSEVDHAIRSSQIAKELLTENQCEKHLMGIVLECIEYHHSATLDNSIEAILLSDADALDFLGAVGVLREVSKNPKDLRKAYSIIKDRRCKLPDRLLFEKTREIASARIVFMDELLQKFEEETFGFF